MPEQDPSISPNSLEGQSDFLEFENTFPSTEISIVQDDNNFVECPEHGRQVKFIISSYGGVIGEDFSIEIGCAKCTALALRELVQQRIGVPF